MSMMYPGGQGIPGANQFAVGGTPNYAQPLLNFNQLPQAVQQAMQQRQQQGQQPQPGAASPPSGPNMGGKAAPQLQPSAMNNFAASLRQFFTPQGQPSGMQPGMGQAMAQGGGFGGMGTSGGFTGQLPPIY
jgi:hypothetical protein